MSPSSSSEAPSMLPSVLYKVVPMQYGPNPSSLTSFCSMCDVSSLISRTGPSFLKYTTPKKNSHNVYAVRGHNVPCYVSHSCE
jgi:hypothetical protein